MANWRINVTDQSTGDAIVNAEINIAVSTTPCPKSFGITQAGCTSGQGYTLNGYTDTNGNYVQDIPYTCVQHLQGTVQASGYNSYPVGGAEGLSTGSITGDVYYNFEMTPASNSTTAAGLTNSKGGLPPGQGIFDTEGVTQAGTNLSTDLSTWWSGAFGEIESLGIIGAVIVVAIAIIVVVLVVVI